MTQYTRSDDVTSHSYRSPGVYSWDSARSLFVQPRHCDASPHALNNPRLMRCTTFANTTLHLNVSRLRRFTCDHRTLKHTCVAFLFSMYTFPLYCVPWMWNLPFYRMTKLLWIPCTVPFCCPFYEIDANVFMWVGGFRFLIGAIDVFLLVPVQGDSGTYLASVQRVPEFLSQG
jgi:hypothetical protein